jgi:hypothetical protein
MLRQTAIDTRLIALPGRIMEDPTALASENKQRPILGLVRQHVEMLRKEGWTKEHKSPVKVNAAPFDL